MLIPTKSFSWAKYFLQEHVFLLKKTEIELLYNSIYAIINEATKFGGASELGFLHLDGSKGTYQNHFKVHKKKVSVVQFAEWKLKQLSLKVELHTIAKIAKSRRKYGKLL